ncbi:MAG: Hsp20 family protein [Bacilli bacterium]|nr:Hsp20 family protein [Bacilli bacterium]
MNRDYDLTINKGQDFFESIINGLWKQPFSASSYSHGLMKTNIEEQEKAYLMTIEVPSFNKEDIKLELEEGYLTVKASKELSKNDEQNFILKEIFEGESSRSYYVGEDVKEESIHAKLENGILSLLIDKVEPITKKKSNITIQ